MTAVMTMTMQRLLEHFANTASDEEILAFNLSVEERERITELLERAAYEELPSEERAELDHLAFLDEEISLLKLRARKRLANP